MSAPWRYTESLEGAFMSSRTRCRLAEVKFNSTGFSMDAVQCQDVVTCRHCCLFSAEQPIHQRVVMITDRIRPCRILEILHTVLSCSRSAATLYSPPAAAAAPCQPGLSPPRLAYSYPQSVALKEGKEG